MASPDTSSGAATKSDVSNLKRQARARDEEHDRAYQAGLTGDDESAPSFDAPDSVHDAYKAGAEDRQATKTAKGTKRARAAASPRRRGGEGSSPSSSRRGSSPTVTRVSEQGASAILGMVAYALVVSYIRYGWPGVTGWLSAKFTNKVTIGAGTSKSSGPANAPGAGNLVQPPGTFKGSPSDADPNNPQPGPIPHRPGFGP